MDTSLCWTGTLLIGLTLALSPGISGQDFESCLTKQNLLRVDCRFQRTESGPDPYCEFRRDNKLLGSTLPDARLSPELVGLANVTLEQPDSCRLILTKAMGSKASTYTCRFLQGEVQERSMALHPNTLARCSALSILFESATGLLLTVMSLPALLGLPSAC